MHWLAHVLGLDNVSGYWYAWHSGIEGNLPLYGLPILYWARHNCHTKRCWRIARRQEDGTTLFHCHKHHSQDPPGAT